jgi:hypothetical protein
MPERSASMAVTMDAARPVSASTATTSTRSQVDSHRNWSRPAAFSRVWIAGTSLSTEHRRSRMLPELVR